MTRRAKVLILVSLGVVTFLLLIRVRGVLTPFFFAGAIAYVSHPLVRQLEKRDMPRTGAILVTYAIVTCVLLIIIYAALPSLTKELEQIGAGLPEKGEQLEEAVRDTLSKIRRSQLADMAGHLVDVIFRRVEVITGALAKKLTDLIFSLFGSVFNVVLAPFLAFYILRDIDTIRESVISWLPKAWREHAIELAQRIDHVVGGFIRSQLIVSLVIGTSVAGGLMLLGVKYALFLGVLTGVADIIPYFGPVVSAVPAIAIALMQSPMKAVYALVLLVIVQQLESGLIAPKIVGDQVGLHPLSVIFAVLAGGELMGIFGMLVAVPVAATVKVIFTYVGEKSLD